MSSPAAFAPHHRTKPIRIIAPFLTSGGVDLSDRLAGGHLSTARGRPLVVENKTVSVAELGAFMTAKRDRWAKIIKLANITVD